MAGPPLLHDDRGDPGVVRAGLEQRADGVAQHLAGDVVEVGLEEHHGLAGDRCGCPIHLGVAEHHLGEVRTAVDLPGPGPEAGGGDGEGRQRPPGADQACEQRRARGGGELDRHVDAAGGGSPEQLDHGRRRVGDGAVRGADHAEAGGDRAGRDVVDVEHLERGTRADDVDDGVEATDLVEVHLARGLAVQPPLGFGEHPEDGLGPLAHTGWQPGLLEQAVDVRGGADHRRLADADVHLRAADAAAQHRLGVELPAGHGEPGDDGAHLVEVGPRVDERAEGHVAGDAREAVEPGRGHGAATGRSGSLGTTWPLGAGRASGRSPWPVRGAARRRAPRRSRCRCRPR